MPRELLVLGAFIGLAVALRLERSSGPRSQHDDRRDASEPAVDRPGRRRRCRWHVELERSCRRRSGSTALLSPLISSSAGSGSFGGHCPRDHVAVEVRVAREVTRRIPRRRAASAWCSSPPCRRRPGRGARSRDPPSPAKRNIRVRRGSGPSSVPICTSATPISGVSLSSRCLAIGGSLRVSRLIGRSAPASSIIAPNRFAGASLSASVQVSGTSSHAVPRAALRHIAAEHGPDGQQPAGEFAAVRVLQPAGCTRRPA